MINRIFDSTESVALIIGLAVVMIPALMFMVHGIRQRRVAMFVVHAFLLAFYLNVIIFNLDDCSEGLKIVFADTAYSVELGAGIVLSLLIWGVVIKVFFKEKD